MSASSGAPRAATVLLVPSSHYDEVRAAAERWVRAWLLDPVVLVRTGAAAVSIERGDHVAVVEAENVARESVRPVPDLLAWLGSGSGSDALELVRVVDLALPRELSGLPPDEVRVEADAIASALKLAANRRRVHRIALIVLPSGHVTDPEGLRQPSWEVNVLASPENRSGPADWEGFVRASAGPALAGFMLAHAASVGGLWSGMRQGSVDDLDRGTEEHVDVQRVTVRAVLHGDRRIRASHVAVSLLTSVADDPVASGAWRLEAEDGASLGLLDDVQREEAVGELVRRLLDEVPDRPLRSRLPDEPLPPAAPAPSLPDRLRSLRQDVRAIGAELARTRRRLSGLLRGLLRRGRSDAPEVAADTVAAEIDRRTEQLEVAGIRMRRELARCVRLPSGLLLAPWNRALGGRDVREHAAGVWRVLHGGTSLLLDGGVRPSARPLSRWMRERAIEGVLAGARAVVPDQLEVWQAPAELHSLLDLDPRSMPSTVRATDLVGLRVWEGEVQRILPAAHAVLESGVTEDGLDPYMAGRVVATAEELRARIEELEATVVGRLLVEVAEEFRRLADAFVAVSDAVGRATPPAVPAAPVPLADALRAAALPSAGVLALLAVVGTRGSWVAAAVGLLLAAPAAAIILALGRARVRTARLRALERWGREVDHLRGSAETLLTEWRRSAHMNEDVEAMVELLSHLDHHGVEVFDPEPATVVELGPEDVPLVVRLAVPSERDADGLRADRPDVVRPVAVCLERLLVAGWRADAQDLVLDEVVRVEPELLGGIAPAEAIDERPGAARDLLARLIDGGRRYERAIGDVLVRRGVSALEGSLAPERTPVAQLSEPGMPGAPGSLVRVLTHATSSSDTRRDALARSLRPDPNWDAFLLEGVGADDPFSASVYATGAAGSRAVASRVTQVHGPVRLARRARIHAGDVRYVPVRDDLAGHAEVVVRIDMQPDPVRLTALRVFDAERR